MEMFQEIQTDGLLSVNSELDLLCLHMVVYDVIQPSLRAFKNLYISGLNQLKEDEEQGKFEGQVTELIQGKKQKPLTEWCGYADTLHRCAMDKFRVDLSLHDLVSRVSRGNHHRSKIFFFFMQRVNV
ncbi:hypothetical protein GHT06_008818 [Daphnia sinensis]|uniref:Uncharacterized protein n=1 Tax=Daphnia sinensis TaxID=1820382 RepID=A0AAD5LN34_9CRUS|nr:hypothetical protein GHT06_008818 [Daphnia sinensis]